MKAQPEYHLQVMVCQYLNMAYPKLLWMSDTIAQVKLTIPQQLRNKKIQRSGFHCPDLLIFEPRGIYNGLFLELKATNIYKKDGNLFTNEHLANQSETIQELNNKGYYSRFVVGFDEAKEVIDWYMKL